MSNTDHTQSIYIALLLKELDIIQDTIKNLDDIIYKTKNFAFLLWGGSLYLFVEHLTEVAPVAKAWLFGLTGIIPLLFWMMDFRWRKHLLQCSERERIISLFINSPAFPHWLEGSDNLEKQGQFPLYDPVGWIYTKKAFGALKDSPFGAQYLIDNTKFGWRRVAFYKDAYIFYGALMVLSIVFSLFYVWRFATDGGIRIPNN